MSKLICDTRERNVLRHTSEFTGINYNVIQMTTGDYCIASAEGKILVIIERKTYDDFASSLKDGRHSNKEKLIKLREETGCKIIYIIEGDAFPAQDKVYSGIPYKNIESSIFHMMVRDNISMIYTKNTLDTAKMLVRLIHSMNTLAMRASHLQHNNIIIGGCTVPNTKESITELIEKTALPEVTIVPSNETSLITILTENQSKPIENTAISEEGMWVEAILTKKQPKTIEDSVREMWACFRGITMESAIDYMKYYSISDILCSRVSVEDLRGIKLATGHKINKTVLTSLVIIDRSMIVKIIAIIPGISKVTSEAILSYGPIEKVVGQSVDIIANITIGKRKLGPAQANKFLSYLHYKST